MVLMESSAEALSRDTQQRTFCKWSATLYMLAKELAD